MKPAGLAWGEVRTLKLSEVETRPASETRHAPSEEAVLAYMETLDDLPPAKVVRTPEGQHLLADGYHRWLAAERSGDETFRCVVAEGTYEQAFEFACKANESHGVRRTNEDKRRAVEAALKQFTEWSDSRLSELCGVDNMTVSRARREMESTCEIRKLDTLVGADGKSRPAKRPAPPKPVEAPAAPVQPVVERPAAGATVRIGGGDGPVKPAPAPERPAAGAAPVAPKAPTRDDMEDDMESGPKRRLKLAVEPDDESKPFDAWEAVHEAKVCLEKFIDSLPEDERPGFAESLSIWTVGLTHRFPGFRDVEAPQ